MLMLKKNVIFDFLVCVAFKNKKTKKTRKTKKRFFLSDAYAKKKKNEKIGFFFLPKHLNKIFNFFPANLTFCLPSSIMN